MPSILLPFGTMLSRDKCNVSAKGKGQACVCFLAKCQWQRNAKRNDNAGTGLLNSRALAGVFLWQGVTLKKGERQ